MNVYKAGGGGVVDLRQIYGGRMLAFAYARFGLYELAMALKAKTALVPRFICSSAIAPLQDLGLRLYFYDVDRDMEPIFLESYPQIDLILAVNYFGFPCDMAQFKAAAKRFGGIVVEDNTHGFLSRDESGILLGLRGDAGLLSMRKSVFLPNGAALILNNPNIAKISAGAVKTSSEDSSYAKKFVIRRFLFSKYLGLAMVLARQKMRGAAAESLSQAEQVKEAMSANKSVSPMVSKLKIKVKNNFVSERRAAFEKLTKEAKKFGITPIFSLDSKKFSNVAPFNFAFIEKDKEATARFTKRLYALGYFLLSWPDLPACVVDEMASKTSKENAQNFYPKVKVVPFLW